MFKKLLLILGVAFSGLVLASGGHQEHTKKTKAEAATKSEKCEQNTLLCSKTVTSAFAPNGELWRVWAYQKKMYYQISKDLGQQFGPVQQVNIEPETVSYTHLTLPTRS